MSRDWTTMLAVAGLLLIAGAGLCLHQSEIAAAAVGGVVGWLSPKPSTSPPQP